MSIGNGGIIGKKNVVTGSVASGVFTINEQNKFASTNTWPKVINVSVAPNVTVVNEGGTVTFNVMADGIDNGTTLYWTTNTESGTINTGDFVTGTLSGSFTVDNALGQITRTIAIDATTPETGESFSISIRSGSTVGPVLATSVPVTISNVTFNIQASATSINEGGVTVSFDITSSGIDLGQTIYFELASSVGTINASDFLGQISGTFQVIDGVMTLLFTTRADQLTEGTESFFLQLKYATSLGVILGTSETININDTSINPTIILTPVVTTLNEGATNGFSISASPSYTSPILLYWEVINVTGTLNFSATSGTISNFVSTGSFNVTTLTSGSGGTYQIRLRNGGASGSILATSATITVNDITGTVTTMSFVESVTVSNANITIPATAAIGDIAILIDAVASPTNDIVPVDFTEIITNNIGTYRSKISYKKLVSGDPGSTITGMSASIPRKIMLIFRPNSPISNIILSTPIGQGTTANPAVQTISMAGQPTPIIGIVAYRASAAVSPRTSSLPMTEVASGNTAMYAKYIIFNSSPQDGTVDMDDEGNNNILQSFFIRFE